MNVSHIMSSTLAWTKDSLIIHLIISSGPIRYALLGSYNKTATQSGVLYNVSRLIAYPIYAIGIKKNDLALVELDRRYVLRKDN